MIDNGLKTFDLRSVNAGSLMCHQEQANYKDVIYSGAVVAEITEFPEDQIAQLDGCSIALDEHVALVVREPHCTNDTWKSALLWTKEKGFQGEPVFLGVDAKEPNLEMWAIARFEESE